MSVEVARRLQFYNVRAREPAADLCDLRVSTAQRFNYHRRRAFRHGLIAAGEDVRRRVAVLRPGMDGNMGFGDGQNAGYALGRKLVKRLPNNMSFYSRRCPQHFLTDMGQVVKQPGVAISKFQEHVST